MRNCLTAFNNNDVLNFVLHSKTVKRNQSLTMFNQNENLDFIGLTAFNRLKNDSLIREFGLTLFNIDIDIDIDIDIKSVKFNLVKPKKKPNFPISELNVLPCLTK